MLISIFIWIFKKNGWKLDTELRKNFKRAVLIAAPHTSNWDFVYAMAAFRLMGLKIRFTIKKEWLSFPLNLFMEPLGAIPIDRKPATADKPRQSMVDAMTDLFTNKEEMIVLVTPEGTRKPQSEWKTGFYHVALNAKVPILFGYLDYEKKIAGITNYLEPTGNIDEDMKKIMDFYVPIKGKFPENFLLDSRFI